LISRLRTSRFSMALEAAEVGQNRLRLYRIALKG
jgi:hypothetical protein